MDGRSTKVNVSSNVLWGSLAKNYRDLIAQQTTLTAKVSAFGKTHYAKSTMIPQMDHVKNARLLILHLFWLKTIKT